MEDAANIHADLAAIIEKGERDGYENDYDNPYFDLESEKGWTPGEIAEAFLDPDADNEHLDVYLAAVGFTDRFTDWTDDTDGGPDSWGSQIEGEEETDKADED